MTTTPQRTDASALVWGLLFASLAALGIWYGLGHPTDWRVVLHLSPLILMVVGSLGLLVGRRRR